MIVSHKHKFIYIHPHKCAGTSITESLIPDLGEDDVVVGVTDDGKKLDTEKGKWRNCKHAGASHIKTNVGKDVWADYFKFSFVRNPFDRCVSWYFWFLQKCGEDNRHVKNIREMTFNEFIASDDFNHIRQKFSFSNQVCIEGVPQTNYVGYFETLQRDFDNVCSIIGLKKRKLEKYNATKRSLHGSYYSEKSIELVSQFFPEDIRMHNYTFTGRHP